MALQKTTIEITEELAKHIERVIKTELEKEIDATIKRFNEFRKGEIVAGVLVDVMKTVDMNISQDRLVFTIRVPKDNEKN